MRSDLSLRLNANGSLRSKDAKADACVEMKASAHRKVPNIRPTEGDAFNSRRLERAFSKECNYRKGEAIFTRGERADALYVVRVGRIKLTVASRGKKAVLRLVGSGDVFGEECLISEHFREATAVAIEPSVVALAPRASIGRTLRQHPAVMGELISHLLHRVQRVEEELVDQIINSSEKRLARVLLTLAGIDENSSGPKSFPAVDQKTLAEMVGTTRARVSYFMNRFRERDFIDYNGSLQIHPGLLRFLNQK
jgi:CRP/FNR family transcriptional regulator, cyclic AMP receptor protein